MNLFISTATSQVIIGFFESKTKIDEIIEYEGKNNHNITFFEQIEQHKEKLSKVTEIYVVNGPGSFTGLRVGVLFAKTFALEKKIRLHKIDLLTALELTNEQKLIGVDARSKKYFVHDGPKIVIKEEQELPNYNLDAKIIQAKIPVIFAKSQQIEPLELDVEYFKNVL
ncbi:MAG: tRNA (adenosine(37)-N6)-threonylcarbamoyltransferase complex dimerization subunit type 1 TsaB [Mycoplasmatales bacterium]